MKAINSILIILFITLTACGTTDSTLKQQNKSDSYIMGFHDGRHSGMREAGNHWEHYIKDHNKFLSDADYQAGWLAGEKEGKKLQARAASIGQTMGNAYSASQIEKEVKKNTDFNAIGQEAVKGVNVQDLELLR